MAPKKSGMKKVTTDGPVMKRTVSVRGKCISKKNSDVDLNDECSKRKAASPLKPLSKRSAFGDITNDADISKKTISTKKDTKQVKAVPHVEKKGNNEVGNENYKFPVPSKKPGKSNSIQSFPPKVHSTKSTVKNEKTLTSSVPKVDSEKSETVSSAGPVNKSPESSVSELYVTAMEELAKDEEKPVEKKSKPPPGVNDFDAENLSDPFQVSEYAMEIFSYLKEREVMFKVEDYMKKQVNINQTMRALLVDWLVEMQENFELNHETLYLAVKLTDLYLSKVTMSKEMLQLVGAAAIFIASKYDERIAPMLEEMVYVCDGAYNKKELVQMEINILKKVGFELGVPLSYRFLRRYARCAKVTMPILTLARYILELSLMEYSFVCASDSKIAAAALLLALKMKQISCWTATLEYYSGYKLEDIKDLTIKLNNMLKREPNSSLTTIRNKYSHKIFFEVAKEPVLSDLTL